MSLKSKYDTKSPYLLAHFANSNFFIYKYTFFVKLECTLAYIMMGIRMII